MFKFHRFAGVTLLVVSWMSTSASAAIVNGFANGGLEIVGTTSPAESWLVAASGYTLSTDARTGNFAAQLSSPELNAAVMLQNSVDDGLRASLTAGDTPELSFWAKGFAGSTGNASFALRYLDGNGVILRDSGLQFFHTSINPNTWTEITFVAETVPAEADAAFIEFSQAIGPINANNLAGTVLVDDVFLGVQAVPEPTSTGLLVLGCIAIARRRCSRKAKRNHALAGCC